MKDFVFYIKTFGLYLVRDTELPVLSRRMS
jgi:hypothetical protein